MSATKTDIEIARAAKKRPIAEIGAKLGIPTEALCQYGPDKAKVGFDFMAGLGLTSGRGHEGTVREPAGSRGSVHQRRSWEPVHV